MRTRAGLALEILPRERRQVHGLRGVVKEERLARRTARLLGEEFSALLQQLEV